MFFFCVDILYDFFVNDKGKVQIYIFIDFFFIVEFDEEDVYDKIQVQGKCVYFNYYFYCYFINYYIFVYESKIKSFYIFMFYICQRSNFYFSFKR